MKTMSTIKKEGVTMDKQTKADIERLMNVARQEIIDADKSGNSSLFSELGRRYGPIAYRVYLALDVTCRAVVNYHNEAMPRVLLDPYTILNRANTHGIRELGLTPDSLEFWNHADMVKTLIDYLSLTYLKEVHYVPCAA